MCRFGLKIGLYFAHFVLEKGMVFKGSMGVYECIFIISIPNDCQRTKERKKEICANSKWILRNLLCCSSNLSNDDIICLRPGLTMGLDFRAQSEKGADK